MKPEDRPKTSINGNDYRVNWFTGLGTNIANDNDYITVYLEDLEGQSYEFLWLPEYQGGEQYRLYHKRILNITETKHVSRVGIEAVALADDNNEQKGEEYGF